MIQFELRHKWGDWRRAARYGILKYPYLYIWIKFFSTFEKLRS